MQTAPPVTRTARRPPAPLPAAVAQATPARTGPVARRLSCACGGACPRCAAAPRLAVGPDSDSHEHEAAAVAAQALRGADPVPAAAVPASGGALAPALRGHFEPRLGVDLGAVRVHHDAAAARSARGVAARAYTVGSDIVFGAGEYRPATAAGSALLAHELVHVRQHMQGADTVLRRTPCPSCHKPQGTQRITLEALQDDFVFYLPDDVDVQEFFTFMRAGLEWGMYKGGQRTDVQAVRHYDFDGSSAIVGYVLSFASAQGINGLRPVVTIDIDGKQLDVRHVDPQAIQSVMSPIDFIGPGLLTKPFIAGTRAVVGGTVRMLPKAGAMLSRSARNLALTSKLRLSQGLGAAMRSDFSAVATGTATRSSLVLREGRQMAAAATGTEAATVLNQPLRQVQQVQQAQAAGPSFADVSQAVRAEVPGTVRYRSTAAAASAAREAGLESAQRPGFQTHATASPVRRAFGVSGSDWQSAHIVPQAVYRALRAAGWRVSEGRALTTLLPRQAHAAFDSSWVPVWNNAVAAGQTIRAGDVYRWVSRAINAVDDQVINASVKAAINNRLRTELFVDLGLGIDDIIIRGVP